MTLSRLTHWGRARLTRLAPALLAAALTLGTAGCNVFDFIDSPSGDAQLLSAARACFDQGDIACAQNYYSQLSTSTVSDTAIAESIFATLNDEGIDMATFMGAMAGGATGGITTIANSLATKGGNSAARRDRIYQALRKVRSINQAQTRGLSRLIAGVALAAEMFAETAGADNRLQQADYTQANCKNSGDSGLTGCGCKAALSNNLSDASGTLDSISSMTSTNPTQGQIVFALLQIDTGMSATELNAGGGFGEGLGEFVQAIQDLGGGLAEGALNFKLVSFGIGE